MTVQQVHQAAAAAGAPHYSGADDAPFRSRPGKRRAALKAFMRVVEAVKAGAYKLARIFTGRPARAASNARDIPICPAAAFHQWTFAPDGPLYGLERLGREMRAQPTVPTARNDDRQERAANLLMDLEARTNTLVSDETGRKEILLSVLARCLPDTLGYLRLSMYCAAPCRSPSALWCAVLHEHSNTRFDEAVGDLAAQVCPSLENALCKARNAYVARSGLEQDREQADQAFAHSLGVMLLPFLAEDGQAAERWRGMAGVLAEYTNVPTALPPSACEGGDADDLQRAWKSILRLVAALENGIDQMSQAVALSFDAREGLEARRDAALLASLNQCPSWERLSQANAALNWMMFTDESRGHPAPMLDLAPDLEAERPRDAFRDEVAAVT
jgi:hypothetical protein